MSEPENPENGTVDLLRRFVAERDVLCPQCEYNLRNLMADRCPECGEKIVLRVNLAEPKQGLLIAGLVGLSAGAGLNGLLLVYFLIQVAKSRNGGVGVGRFLVINSVGFVVVGAALAMWLVRWRRIRRASVVWRSLLVIGCWGLTLADIVIFSLFVR